MSPIASGVRHDYARVDPLAALAADPAPAALFLDVDGMLAPIVERPEDARVPDATRAELRRLAGRYGLVACVTGRTSEVAREIVGVDGLRTSASTASSSIPRRRAWAERIRAFAVRRPGRTSR